MNNPIKIFLMIFSIIMILNPVYPLERDNFSISFCVGMSWNYLIKKAFYEVTRSLTTGDVDAASGATKLGFNTGVHVETKVFDQFFQTGLDFNFDQLEANYHDTAKNRLGTRTLTLANVTLSTLYDFHLFNRPNTDPQFNLGIGFFGAYYPYQKADDTGNLDSFHMAGWTFGPCVRVYYYPFELSGRNYLGFYLDLRQSLNQFYIDPYFDNNVSWKTGSKTIGLIYNY